MKKGVERSLIEQLGALGRDTPYTREMISSYMELKRQKDFFAKEISERGEIIDLGDKILINPAIKAYQDTVMKMQSLLSKMKLDTPCADENEEL